MKNKLKSSDETSDFKEVFKKAAQEKKISFENSSEMSAIEFFYFASTRQLRTKTVKNDTAQKWTFPSRISLVNVTKHALP